MPYRALKYELVLQKVTGVYWGMENSLSKTSKMYTWRLMTLFAYTPDSFMYRNFQNNVPYFPTGRPSSPNDMVSPGLGCQNIPYRMPPPSSGRPRFVNKMPSPSSGRPRFAKKTIVHILYGVYLLCVFRKILNKRRYYAI